jgi:hypothetical protein
MQQQIESLFSFSRLHSWPRFEAEITYAKITDDGMVRHPTFKRLVP